MPDIASVLKEEIARIARKETRADIASLRKTAASQRADIAELKRQLAAAHKALAAVNKTLARQAPPAAETAPDPGKKPRFSAKGLASHRQRLGLSAEHFGRLIGVGGQSIYNWESGEAHPRERYLNAIDALRKMGKKEALARLQSLDAAG